MSTVRSREPQGTRLLRKAHCPFSLQDETVNWLNNNLSTAIGELLELRGDALLRLMLEVREALASSGAELVLLIEDFAKLQGIDMQLLEAIIAKPRQEGRERLCVLRTALACTTGYFRSLFQTVQTRVDFCVTLDVESASDSRDVIPPADVEQFAARYLNVARLRESELTEWYDTVRSNGDESVPIACDGCVHREMCHGSFGDATASAFIPSPDGS